MVTGNCGAPRRPARRDANNENFMELKVIETMKIFNGKANARQHRINIRELMVTGSCKAPEETRKVEKNVLITNMAPVDDVDTELLLRMIIIRFNGIHIVFMAEGRGRRFAKEGGRGRSQRETRDYDPKYTRQ